MPATRPPSQTAAVPFTGQFFYSPPTGATQTEAAEWLESENAKYRRNPAFRKQINRLLCDALNQANTRAELSTASESLRDELTRHYQMTTPPTTATPEWMQAKTANFDNVEQQTFYESWRQWETINSEIDQAVAQWRTERDRSPSASEPFDLLQSPRLLTLTQERTRLSIQVQDAWEALPADVQQATLAETASVTAFPLFTGQESHALTLAQADGKRFAHYHKDAENAMIWHDGTKTHGVRLRLSDEEQDAGLTLAALETLIKAQDADAIFAAGYVLGTLAEKGGAATWFDLADIGEKIGLRPEKQSERGRDAVRQRVWNFLQFLDRANIYGERSIKYIDKRTKKHIDTQIQGGLIMLGARQKGAQTSLFPALNAPPFRVQIAMNADLLPLFVHPDLKQFLNGLQVVAAIPAGKPGTAWARGMALSLMREWRMKSTEAANGELWFTRRELLETYAPATNGVAEVMAGTNPKRAREYWRDAVAEMITHGVVARESPEGAPGAVEIGVGGLPLPRQAWAGAWMNAQVLLIPGEVFAGELRKQGAKRFIPKIRDLSATEKPKRKRRKPEAE